MHEKYLSFLRTKFFQTKSEPKLDLSFSNFHLWKFVLSNYFQKVNVSHLIYLEMNCLLYSNLIQLKRPAKSNFIPWQISYSQSQCYVLKRHLRFATYRGERLTSFLEISLKKFKQSNNSQVLFLDLTLRPTTSFANCTQWVKYWKIEAT